MIVVHVKITIQAQLHYTSKMPSLNVKADRTYRNQLVLKDAPNHTYIIFLAALLLCLLTHLLPLLQHCEENEVCYEATRVRLMLPL